MTNRYDDLPPSHLTEVLELAHQVYHQAVKSHISALNAEKERLKRAISDQRRELERIPDRLWVAKTLEAEEQTDKIRGLMLQVRRLGGGESGVECESREWRSVDELMAIRCVGLWGGSMCHSGFAGQSPCCGDNILWRIVPTQACLSGSIVFLMQIVCFSKTRDKHKLEKTSSLIDQRQTHRANI